MGSSSFAAKNAMLWMRLQGDLTEDDLYGSKVQIFHRKKLLGLRNDSEMTPGSAHPVERAYRHRPARDKALL